MQTHLTVGQRLRFAEFSSPATVVKSFVGGFGEVYVMREDDETEALYAAKTPRRDLSHIDTVLKQFAYEATLWVALPVHPNVLPAYDVRLYNKQPFVRMKYVPPHWRGGSSLEEMIAPDNRGHRLVGHVNFLAYISGQLTGVLADLESSVPGFVHGDIKPANLLLEPDPQAARELHDESVVRLRLSDFGLAWSLAMREIGHPLAAGDAQYLAPETFLGDFGTKTQDMYAVGCTLFEIATGEPYQVSAPGRSVPRDPISVEAFMARRPDVPRGLLSLILSCLELNQRNRPATFAELHAAFRASVTEAGGIVRDIKAGPTHEDVRWREIAETYPLEPYLIKHRKLSSELAAECVRGLTDANQSTNLGLFVRSEDKLKEVLAIVPDFPPALACRAYRRSLQGRTDEAVHWYTRAIEGYWEDDALRLADPLGYAAACATAAQLIAGDTKRDEDLPTMAAYIASKAVEVFPESAKSWLAYGMAMLRMRQFDMAERMLDAAHGLDPSNKVIQHYRGAVLLARKRCKESARAKAHKKFGLERTTIDQACKWLKAVGLC